MNRIISCTVSLCVCAILFAGSALADFEDGRRAANDGDFQAAYAIWAPLAEQGDAQAQFGLGRMYLRGDGVNRDFARARELLRRAAEQGHSRAQMLVAKMYQNGDGGEENLDEALRWYHAAAGNGESEAQQILTSLNQAAAKREAQEPVSPHTAAPAGAVTGAASNPDKRAMNEAVLFCMIAVFVVFILVVINGIRLGLTDKMIFYNSGWDLAGTLLVWLLPALMSFPMLFAFSANSGKGPQQISDGALAVTAALPFAVGALVVAVIFVKNIRYNGFGLGSLCVFTAKISLSLLVLFYWGRMNKRDSSLGVRLHALALLSLLAYLMSALVNGEEVRQNRAALTAASPA